MSHLAPHYHLTREFNFSVVTVDRNGDVLEVLAVANNVWLADAAFEAALTRYTRSLVQIRNISRVMRTVDTGQRSSQTD